jgi:hypothetical protein
MSFSSRSINGARKKDGQIPIDALSPEVLTEIASLSLDAVKNLTQQVKVRDQLLEYSKGLVAGPNATLLTQRCKQAQMAPPTTPNEWTLLPSAGKHSNGTRSLEIVEFDSDDDVEGENETSDESEAERDALSSSEPDSEDEYVDSKVPKHV